MLFQRLNLTADAWQIRYLFRLGSQSWLIHIGVVSLLGFLLVQHIPDTGWPWFWWAGMILASLVLVSLSRHYASASTKQDLSRPGQVHTAFTTIVGLGWGAGAFGAAESSFEILALYSLALGGTAMGAVSSQHALPRSCFASVWTSLPLLAFAHLRYDDDLSALPVAAMMILFALVLSILCVRMHRFLATNQNLTQSLNTKVAELTRTTADLEHARKNADEANLSKSRFLAQASHDLRQPIHAIGLITASLKDTKLSKEQQKMVDSVEQSIDSVTSLFGSLLDISRLDVGGISPRFAPLDLGAFINRSAAQNREIAAKNQCDFLHVGSHYWVETDADLLFTMVQNILGNAFKYAPGSRVLIGPRLRKGGVAIQICDTGPGIVPEHLDAVFTEFYRLRNTPGRNIEGMGLGLPIVKGLADLLGLEIILKSQPGRGSSVIISGLKITEPMAAKVRRPTRTHPLAGKQIYLVENDKNVRGATTQLLENWGCIVTARKDWRHEVAGSYDAILADATSKNFSSVSAVRGPLGEKIPTVILTGHGDRKTLNSISAVGLPVLKKPVRPAELRAMLTRLCLGL